MPWELDREFSAEQKRLHHKPAPSGTTRTHDWGRHWLWMCLGYLTLLFSQHLILALYFKTTMSVFLLLVLFGILVWIGRQQQTTV